MATSDLRNMIVFFCLFFLTLFAGHECNKDDGTIEGRDVQYIEGAGITKLRDINTAGNDNGGSQDGDGRSFIGEVAAGFSKSSANNNNVNKGGRKLITLPFCQPSPCHLAKKCWCCLSMPTVKCWVKDSDCEIHCPH